jgi:hypothetical protein
MGRSDKQVICFVSQYGLYIMHQWMNLNYFLLPLTTKVVFGLRVT